MPQAHRGRVDGEQPEPGYKTWRKSGHSGVTHGRWQRQWGACKSPQAGHMGTHVGTKMELVHGNKGQMCSGWYVLCPVKRCPPPREEGSLQARILWPKSKTDGGQLGLARVGRGRQLQGKG